ncbi:MAG TPA: DUF1015 domain-containing protein [Syntrophorhabdaceae bacterium]|nr:DUF1015 domain-containing protein [Syntrophorhabdaceae bacterium]
MRDALTKPFKGILYNKQKVSDVSSVVCPPYDVISQVEPYYKKHNLNAIRLELPQAAPPLNQYETARRTMDEWLKEGVLSRDASEAVYVYEQEFELENQPFLRRGFIALHKLDKERILTHEETRKKAKADREQLIGTLKTYTSLIFGLYEDKDLAIENILAGPLKEKIYDFVDEQSIRNRFYRMTDNDAVTALSAMMGEKKIYIADGHHRLDVSYRLGVPYVPLYLTNMYSQGIVILPYHRIVKFEKERPLGEMLSLLSDYFDVAPHPYKDRGSVKQALTAVEKSSRLSFVLYSKDDANNLYIVTQNKPIPSYEALDVRRSLKRLKVNAIHAGVIKDLLKIKDEEISFTQDHYETVDSVREGALDLAFFLPPTSVEEVKDIADNSLYMPPKSTFFYPKILTGLVFYQYA